MSGRFVIHSAVDLRLLAWSAADTDGAFRNGAVAVKHDF